VALGDGIRRNLATVSKEERDRLRDAIINLQTQNHYPGGRNDTPTGGVSYWFKQDEIHAHTHVHGVPAFVPWHRELINRFEALIRQVDPELSLHYWDWTQDPQNLPDGEGGFINLFTAEFLGSPNGLDGEPFQANAAPYRPDGFYVPGVTPFRSDNEFDPSNNPFDPPRDLTHTVGSGAPIASDTAALNASTFAQFHDQIKISHDTAHGFIGGTLSNAHTSFRDPVAFFLHSNLDRLWAMWQRDPLHPERLDPAHVYDYSPSDWINPATGQPQPEQGSGDVQSGEPWWGFSSPLEPWAGPGAQTMTTGIIANVQATRPWAPPENQQVYKDCRDPSVVMPPSYDTAPHSSYIIANQDTFSSSQAAVNLTFAKAIYVVYDGFQPREVSTPTASNPDFTFAIGGASVTTISASNPQVFLEDPSGAPDVPQRVSILYDIVFTNTSAFPATPGAETAVTMQVTLNYTVGGTSVAATDHSFATLLLVNQPSPYMVDIDPAIPPPGPPNPYWLSTDTRVFKIKQNDSIAGVQQQTDPFGFITGLVGTFNMLPNDNNHPFLTQLSQDENASQLELSPTEGGTPVFNYAVAKIRYRGNVPAQNVSVFFRAFKTMVSALDYDHTSGPTGNYRRSGNTAGSVPLLGIQSNEIASIPFFARSRVDTQTQSMTVQPEDPINTQISFLGNGQEEVIYCGVWLDINDIGHPRFPQDPTSDPGGVNGPYQNPLLTIQQLVTGLHYCLVAEIFFWPPGTTTDPIPVESTPASSDRLAQRNLSLDPSGNPGWPSTHTVQHTFLVKPSIAAIDKPTSIAATREFFIGPDELIIQWGNVPRATQATLFFPEVQVDQILSLSARRQHPAVLAKVDDHTISVKVADATYIPLPARPSGNLAGLMTLVLPQGVRVGQVFKMSVQQCSGITILRRARRMLGAFQFNIPVSTDPDILPNAIRQLSILRYIQQTVPTANRWYPIFVRWLNGLAAKVAGLGGDPTQVLPSPTGGDAPSAPCYEPEPCEVRPRDLWCMNIPWDECDIEGEIDLKLRFRKKGK
jgi:hypothetical protein